MSITDIAQGIRQAILDRDALLDIFRSIDAIRFYGQRDTDILAKLSAVAKRLAEFDAYGVPEQPATTLIEYKKEIGSIDCEVFNGAELCDQILSIAQTYGCEPSDLIFEHCESYLTVSKKTMVPKDSMAVGREWQRALVDKAKQLYDDACRTYDGLIKQLCGDVLDTNNPSGN